MQINANSRQVPKQKIVTADKDYHDLLYAWLQCNSEKVGMGKDNPGRRIAKKDCKYQTIERNMSRINGEGQIIKPMTRRTIAKYFESMLGKGLIKDQGDEYYYLTVLSPEEGCLIEYNTLTKLLNVFSRNCINIYVYLFNRFYACDGQGYYVTLNNIKEYVGIATNTPSNNCVIDDTLDILKRLGLLDYKLEIDEMAKRHIKILWVKNKLD